MFAFADNNANIHPHPPTIGRMIPVHTSQGVGCTPAIIFKQELQESGTLWIRAMGGVEPNNFFIFYFAFILFPPVLSGRTEDHIVLLHMGLTPCLHCMRVARYRQGVTLGTWASFLLVAENPGSVDFIFHRLQTDSDIREA